MIYQFAESNSGYENGKYLEKRKYKNDKEN